MPLVGGHFATLYWVRNVLETVRDKALLHILPIALFVSYSHPNHSGPQTAAKRSLHLFFIPIHISLLLTYFPVHCTSTVFRNYASQSNVF